MRRLFSIGLLLAPLLAFAQAPHQERAKGVAAATIVTVPLFFRQDCEAGAADFAGRLHCVIRTMAVERGAKFTYEMKLREIRDGRDRMVAVFLKTKQFAEKVYDDCMTRRADEIEQAGSFSESNAICQSEKNDTYVGMEQFNKAFNDGLK